MDNLKPNLIILYCFLCLACCTLTTLASTVDSTHLDKIGTTILPPPISQSNKYKDELAQLIKQVRSVKFKSKDQTSTSVIDVKPEPAVQDNKTSSAQKPSLQKEIEKQTSPKATDLLPYEPVSDKTLQILDSLSQNPDRAVALSQPGPGGLCELADILFLSGHLKQAGAFYQQALDRMTPDSAASAEGSREAGSQNRAWILFQLGNCLRDTDPSAAIKMYRQLIAEYPNSLWTDLAKAREQLVDWYRNEKPLALIE